MSHKELALVRAYMMGELSGEEAESFIDHFETCPTCQQAAHDWKVLDNEFASAAADATPEPSDAFIAGVMSRVERKEERDGFLAQLQQLFEGWGLQAAGLACGVFLIVSQIATLNENGTRVDSFMMAYAAQDDVTEFLTSGEGDLAVLFGEETESE